MSRQMKLFAFDFSGPAHLSSGLWRHPEDCSSEYQSLQFWVEYARLLENACFDGIFFADNVGYHDVYQGSVDAALRDAAQIPANDPAYLIPAMAAATRHLGFGVTSTTAYDHPYSLARKFATLDHLTAGRIGWNVVTSYADSAARNLGSGVQNAHDDRYGIAEEFIEVALKLWEGSWEENAVVRDRENCTYVDPRRVHEIKHEGKHFKVPGIFLCEPSPQRTPVIFQAGGSSRGVALAAATAEAVFMNATSKAGLKNQVDRLRAQAAEAGRDPSHIAVLQMITVVTGRTDEEAEQRFEEYRRLVDYEGAMARYSGWAGLDMSTFDPDVPLRHVKTNAGQTMVDLFSKMDPTKEWTPRDIAEYIGIGGTAPVIVGGPKKVADELVAWVEETGIDGFNLGHAVKFQDIKDFADLVVPELQRRGVMRRGYEGSTLRESLFGAGQSRLADDHPGAAIARRLSQ
ncbi:LLM class flavin-dependent oxidoreductase [Pseudomonas vanderleydeniana]|uniref:LLM class flavin-dependent oxidoreductase n=2 Tax=Pseudomonas vanderleydeniana TaxID=2745495 RepID=A0A9E6PQ23_9PSED|nr:LLM class flavin-dependent oxidoreductase [Pseudomonas vanderleydeniana]QXI30574.1 LLM class flavin-dependent oxidoreductase [Pseudomonas vanderleydeniana]